MPKLYDNIKPYVTTMGENLYAFGSGVIHTLFWVCFQHLPKKESYSLRGKSIGDMSSGHHFYYSDNSLRDSLKIGDTGNIRDEEGSTTYCPVCKKIFNKTNFSKNVRKCKQCVNINSKNHYKNHYMKYQGNLVQTYKNHFY